MAIACAYPCTRQAASPDKLLAAYDARSQRLAKGARRLIRKIVPHADERVRATWGLIQYSAPAYFAFIALHPGYVQLGFEWGVILPEPCGLLDGNGVRVRSIVIRSRQELQRDGIETLIRVAAALVPPSSPSPSD